jgi:hypothetical protein
MEFQKGGVFEYSIAAVVEMPYRVDGDQLITPSGTDGGPEQRETIKWLGQDRVQLISEFQTRRDLTRKGGRHGSRTIVGEWRGVDTIGGRQVDAVSLFYPNNKLLFLIPFSVQKGTYSIRDGRVLLSAPDCPFSDAAFNVQGDVLAFTTPDSRRSTYARY